MAARAVRGRAARDRDEVSDPHLTRQGRHRSWSKSGQILDLLRRAQPFKERDHGHEPKDSPIEILRSLNNIDKHRLLLPVVCSIDHAMPAWWGSNVADPTPRYQFHSGPLQAGETIAIFDFGAAEPPPSFAPKFQLVITWGDPEARWLAGMSLGAGLERLAGAVRHLINFGGFAALLGEPLFSPGGDGRY